MSLKIDFSFFDNETTTKKDFQKLESLLSLTLVLLFTVFSLSDIVQSDGVYVLT